MSLEEFKKNVGKPEIAYIYQVSKDNYKKYKGIYQNKLRTSIVQTASETNKQVDKVQFDTFETVDSVYIKGYAKLIGEKEDVEEST
jgi:hypothetical protein